jgi:hypothetical protein
MAKKKKEVCPYCGKSFAYLNRHKCKVKERIEGSEESEKSEVERRIERTEERKKDSTRNLKKDEKKILDIITKEKNIFFEDLRSLTNKTRNELDDILDVLELQSKVKVKREMINATWTKNISLIENIDLEVAELEIDKNKKDFILEVFSYQPCLVCPFANKCNDTNLDKFNPKHCPWLTDWIEACIEGRKYYINFEEIEEELID